MPADIDIWEITGYIASALVFLTFCMKTMIPLRLVAIASNIAFMIYGWKSDLQPIFILHSLLLPLNIFRTIQILKMINWTKDYNDLSDINIKHLLPSMQYLDLNSGDVVFSKGDFADKLYYLASGKIEICEYGVTLEPGNIFGEIGLFSKDKTRTATVKCLFDSRLFYITEERVRLLYYQNPKFGYQVIRLVTQRLIDNIKKLEPESIIFDSKQRK